MTCISRTKWWNCLASGLSIQIRENYRSWLKNLWLGLIKNGCHQPGHRILKLPVSQKQKVGINQFSTCWYKFRRAKSYSNNYLVVVVKNGFGLLGHGNLKFTVSWEWIDADSDVIVCWGCTEVPVLFEMFRSQDI